MDNKKKVIACELVRSSSSARSNAILFLILITITTLSLFIFSPSVKAATVPTFTEEIVTEILNYTKENICLSQASYGYFNDNNITEIQNFIDTFDVSILTSKLNTQLQTRINSKLNSDDTIELNNISIIPYCNYSSSNNFLIGWYFVISKSINSNNTTNSKLGYAYLKKYSQNEASVLTTIYNSNNENIYVFEYSIGTYSSANDFSSRIFNYGNENNWATAVNGTSSKPIPDAEINENTIFMPFYYSLTEGQQVYVNLYDFNNPTLYTNLNYYGSSNSSIITENGSGETSYYIWDNGPTTLDFNGYGKNLNTYFYIGNSLQYENEYYYYNLSGEKINADELVNIFSQTWPQIGEITGRLYQPKTQWVWYDDYYPFNIYQTLKIEYYSGDELLEEKTVVEDLLVINWSDSSISGDIIGKTTGTITNSSGEVIGNYSGEENFGNLGQKEKNEIENALEIDIPIEDPTGDFFTWFFEQLKNCFTINTAQYLNFTILNNEFTINSDDYILNIPVLHDILGIGMGIFILYGIFKDIRGEIEKIKEGNFEQVGKEDISANML